MQLIQSGYRGVSLVLEISLDRILFPFAIVACLAAAAFIGAELTSLQAPELHFMH